MMLAAAAHRAMRAFPIADVRTLLGSRDPLILAPHADDESLGCGGLLALCSDLGMHPAVLVVTDGTGSHPRSARYPPERLRVVREQEARDAVTILGLQSDRIDFLSLPDTAAPIAGPTFETAVATICRHLSNWDCGVILAPWRHDPHCDHEAAHLMAQSVASIAGVLHLAYPVWGWTVTAETALIGPEPTGSRLDVTGVLDRKRDAIAAHRSQNSALIDDDPSAFRLAPEFLDFFVASYETYLTNP